MGLAWVRVTWVVGPEMEPRHGSGCLHFSRAGQARPGPTVGPPCSAQPSPLDTLGDFIHNLGEAVKYNNKFSYVSIQTSQNGYDSEII